MVQLGLRFAKIERKLNELERSRAIYVHLSQYCDPNLYEGSFWRIWEQFEVNFGNKDTYDDYLRIKRTVQLRYAVVDPALQDKVDQNIVNEIDSEMAEEKPLPKEVQAPS